ncbi:MAG: hypothetical protein EU981_02125 [Candidatus Liberibacter ctenarytainae]|uniref:Tetratricopeptide repeat protein n=1 Tax=Candidatus Liberibacter ctenarytainae TaxID=2020335 RepID=A0A937ART8_9HYPH|nr:hypothetical protein [Candidatus Liberibacter ctenarytainae]
MIVLKRMKSYLLFLIRTIGYILITTTLVLGSGCSLSRNVRPSIPDLSFLEDMNHRQLLDFADMMGKKYQANSTDKTIGIIYADALRRIGRPEQALAVMQNIAIVHPTDREVLADYGKSLASASRLEDALDAIERAQRPDIPDWKLISTKASILCQMGRNAEALIEYNKALELAPNESSIVSNLAMSYLLMGDIKKAEEKLRYAANMLGSDSRVRQNLALVIGLQGRTEEAYDIASQELSPEEATKNIAYLKSILSQKDPWKKMRVRDKKNHIQKTSSPEPLKKQ